MGDTLLNGNGADLVSLLTAVPAPAHKTALDRLLADPSGSRANCFNSYIFQPDPGH